MISKALLQSRQTDCSYSLSLIHKVGQAGPPFQKPTLTGSDALVIAQVPLDGAGDDLHHDIPQRQGHACNSLDSLCRPFCSSLCTSAFSSSSCLTATLHTCLSKILNTFFSLSLFPFLPKKKSAQFCMLFKRHKLKCTETCCCSSSPRDGF